MMPCLTSGNRTNRYKMANLVFLGTGGVKYCKSSDCVCISRAGLWDVILVIISP